MLSPFLQLSGCWEEQKRDSLEFMLSATPDSVIVAFVFFLGAFLRNLRMFVALVLFSSRGFGSHWLCVRLLLFYQVLLQSLCSFCLPMYHWWCSTKPSMAICGLDLWLSLLWLQFESEWPSPNSSNRNVPAEVLRLWTSSPLLLFPEESLYPNQLKLSGATPIAETEVLLHSHSDQAESLLSEIYRIIHNLFSYHNSELSLRLNVISVQMSLIPRDLQVFGAQDWAQL